MSSHIFVNITSGGQGARRCLDCQSGNSQGILIHILDMTPEIFIKSHLIEFAFPCQSVKANILMFIVVFLASSILY